ncbi:DEAD/DEAH box helicase [Flavihumibacter sp. R14]|nr:DEAD/DEAH box helicase [Flavihumibacter soli]
MLLDTLKLSKPLIKAMTEAGFLTAKEVQLKTMSRMIGAQDMIVSAPEGSGKTTAYVLATLMRLKFGVEEAPRALILVPDKDRVQSVLEQFELLNKNKSIRVIGMHGDQSVESQMDALADGADIVVSTPERARAIYLKLGLNLNKIIMFIVDDAELIIKKGLQLPVSELARSITRCQHLIFTEVIHGKLHHMIDPFMNFPVIIEIENLSEQKLDTRNQVLYNVPDFRTKINLLNLLSERPENNTKCIVFVNTRLTAQKLYKGLIPSVQKTAAILNPLFFDQPGFSSVVDFVENSEFSTLIVANEGTGVIFVQQVPVLIHLEVPDEKETYLNRVMKDVNSEELISVIFSTDIELATVKKIEHAIGHPIPKQDLPEGLIIYKGKSKTNSKDVVVNEEATGAAFHKKKESNAKDYNFSSREKAKMNRKKKH